MVTVGITDQHLMEVYSDPYISRIGHDHRPAAPIQHPNATYLSAWVDGKFSGAFIAIKASPVELELHALLKKSAIKQSRHLGLSFLAWAFAQPILRVTAYIIQGLETAKNYCIKLGFKIEGCRRCACLQNGVVKGVYVLGMTRQDWRAI
jgi:hypothetical protein